jgi:TP901 family phage tail tape measure protein
MAGQFDAELVIGANTKLLESQTFDAVRRLEARPVRVRVDASGLGQISTKVGEFEKALQSAGARVISFGATAGQVYLISRAMDALIRSTIEVQKELADINNIFGLSSKQLEGFSTSLFKVANETGQSFKIAASSALEFSRQGLSVSETLKRTKDALTLTRLSGLDVVESTKAITAALNSFNDVALDSTVLVNKLATVDAQFSVSSGDLAQALQRVGSTAQDTGVSFDSLIALVTSAQQQTQRGGAVIGNALKSIFQRVQRPEVLDNLKQLGILTEDVNGKILSSDAILKNTAQAYKTLSDAQREQIVQLSSGLFQANQFRAILQDLGKQSSIYERALSTSANSSDQAARRQAELNKTLASELNQSLNNLQQFGAKVGNLSIAPALKNLFKFTDFAATSDIGENLGTGILKGLGNYLSGPGLVLAGTLVSKLFATFTVQAAKSFATILEVSSARARNERIILDLLQSEPGAIQKINAAGNETYKVQQVVSEILAKQNAQLNANAAAAARVAEIISKFSLGGVGATAAPFVITNEKITGNSRAKNIPGFSALSDAIERETKAGINPSQIRVGSSGELISADNPLGIGIYNTKDEPLGLQQGINRSRRSGNDPKKAGNIPNFADIPYPFNLLPSNLVPEEFKKAKPIFNPASLAPDSVRYGTPPPEKPFPLLLGAGTGKNAIQLPEISKSTLDLNISLKKSTESLDNFIKAITKASDVNFGTAEQKTKSFNPGAFQFYPSFSGAGNSETSVIGNAIFNLANNKKILDAQANRFNIANQRTVNQSILLPTGVNGEQQLLREDVRFKGIREANIINKQIDEYLSLVSKGASESSEEMQKFKSQIIQNTQKLSYTTKVLDITKDPSSGKITTRGIRTIDNGASNVAGVTKVLNEGGALSSRIFQSGVSGDELLGPGRAELNRGLSLQEDQIIEEELQNRSKIFQSKLDKLNIFNSVFKDNKLSKESENLGENASFQRARQRVAGQALLGSFALPILTGVIQNTAEGLIGNNSTTARGANASIGAAGNIGSYALTGLGLSGGNPLGAVAGAGVGALLELPTVFKAFSDTLPDLSKRLELLTDSAQKTSVSLSSYVSISQQLASIGNDLSATALQKRLLEGQKNIAFAGIPSEFRGRIQSAVTSGNFSEANNIADIAQTINSQNINSGKDASILNSTSKPGGFESFERGFFTTSARAGNSENDPVIGQYLRGKRLDRESTDLERVQQFSSSLLTRLNTSGQSLQDVLSPKDLEQIQSSRSGGLSGFLSALKPILSSKGFGSQFGDISQQVSEAGKNNPDFLSKVLFGKFSSSNINANKENSKVIDKNIQLYDDALETINSDLIKFLESSSKSLNNFDIKILKGLSRDVSNIDVRAINRQGANQISILNSGDNSYFKNYVSFQEKLAQDKDEFDKAQKQLKAELSISSNEGLVSGKNDLLKLLKDSIEKNKLNGDAESINSGFKKSSSFVSSVFGNINSNSPEQINYQIAKQIENVSLVKGSQALINTVISDLNSNDKKISGTSLNKISKLPEGDLKNTLLGGKIDNISNLSLDDKTIKSIQDELVSIKEKINGSLLKYIKDLSVLRSNLASNDAKGLAEFNNNEKFLNVQFAKAQNNIRQSGIIDRNSINKISGLQRSEVGANPFQVAAIQRAQSYEAELATQRKNLSTNLSGTVSDVDFNNINKSGIDSLINGTKSKISSLPAGAELETQEVILENLISASTALEEKQKNINDEIENQNKNLDIQLAFTDRIAAKNLENNIGAASQRGNGIGGTALTGASFAQAAAAPFQYNTSTFLKDSVVGLQEFSAEIKNDLSYNLLEITKGAKNASEAFRDLGISLAQSLASKAINIGINSLFGAAFKGIASFAPSIIPSATPPNRKASGGYIPKFAKGGFVNMGSGVRDDVPAFLSGGEFVINKNAVNRIGVDNLNHLNGTGEQRDSFRQPGAFINRPKKKNSFPGVTSDSISINGSSTDITLANAFLINKGKGSFKTSSLLSAIGQTDDNNPQNKLKFSREKYALNKRLAEREYQKQLDAFKFSQNLNLGLAYLGAVGNVVGAFAQVSNSNNPTDNQISALNQGQGPLNSSAANNFAGNNTTINSINSYGTQSYNPYGFGLTSRASGGLIPKFAGGGYFGGENSSDKFSAMVMGGEYVMSPQTVNKYGTSFFKSLNSTAKYADGGYVGGQSNSDDGTTKIINALNQIKEKLSTNGNKNSDSKPQSNVTNHVAVNVSMHHTGEVTSSDSKSSSDSKNGTSEKDSKDVLSKVADNIKGMIVKEMTQQSRPGGILHQTFAPKRT